MPRFKGIRRVCLIVFSALPLLADVPDTREQKGTRDEPPAVEPVEVAASDETPVPTTPPIIKEDALTPLPTLTDWVDSLDYGQHYNVVVPFRPPGEQRSATQQPPGPYRSANVSAGADQASDSSQSLSADKEDDAPDLSSSTSDEANGEAITTVSDEVDEAMSTTDTDEIEPSAKEPEESKDLDIATAERNDDDTVQGNNATQVEGGAPAETALNETATLSVPVDEFEEETVKTGRLDFASKSAGALILEKSAGWKGASDLLNSDNDRYAIIPCAETSKSVVVSLSEDVYVKTIMLANYERFSSTVKDFQLLGSQTMGSWVDLGTYTAKSGGGKQEFELKEYSWARYLKLRVLSHHGDEHYLTISQLSVYGDTMVQGFHEHWEEEQEQEDSVPNDGLADESAAGAAESEDMQSPDTARTRSVNPIAISEFTANDPCVRHSGSTCPKDLSFEQLVFLFSTNQSHADRMSFLSSSTSCRSFHKYEHDIFPEIRVQSISPVAAIATITRETSTEARVVTSDDERTKLAMGRESLVVSQIRDIIKSKAGKDAELFTVNLFKGQQISVADPMVEEEPKAGDSSVETAELVQQVDPSEEKAETSPDLAVPSTPQEHQQTGRGDVMNAKEWEILLKSLERVPSSSCLKGIDFEEYRKRVASSKQGNNGPGNGHSTGGGAELQPIFKKLTDQIKTLQGTFGMQEDFLKSAISCYQKVLLELIVQQEDTRLQTEKRLDELEHAINTYLLWLRFVEDCIASARSFSRSVMSLLSSLWVSVASGDMMEIVVAFFIAFVTVFALRALFFSGWRRLPRMYSSQSQDFYQESEYLSERQQKENKAENQSKKVSLLPNKEEAKLSAGKTEYSSVVVVECQEEGNKNKHKPINALLVPPNNQQNVVTVPP